MTMPTAWHPEPSRPDIQVTATPTLHRRSSIAALVPHYRCERWLGDCLASLVQQTHPLDAIVVIDDGSGEPPVEIVTRYPQVTLLASSENVGPYRLVQQVITDTSYDGYLFQDADDWSSRDRLEVLLTEAERTGAELVGCQEVLVLCHTAEVEIVRYPLDVNHELSTKPTAFALAHHTSVVSRALMERIEGFATGLRCGGDSELLPRAVQAAVVRNVPTHGYFRRQRAGSLTTDGATGLASPERLRVAETLRMRATRDAAARARGEPISVSPSAVAGPVALTPVVGPALRGPAGECYGPARAPSRRARPRRHPAPKRRAARPRRAATR